jgi:hypothetical protein
MQKIILGLAVAAFLGGCTTVGAPQTRAQFVQDISGGVVFTMTESYVAKRRFDDVVSALRQRAPECFETSSTMTRRSGGITTMNVRDDYHTSVKTVSATRAELTIQFTSKGITYVQKVPEGGFYHMAVDVERLTPSTTRLTYYGPSFDSSKNNWKAIQQWSEGQAAACPS